MPLSVRLPEETLAELDARGEKASALRAATSRYFYMLALGRRSLQDKLSDQELSLIADGGNGTLYEAWSIPLLAHGVSDSIELDGLDAKWKVDGSALIKKLNALEIVETFALADAVERFWNGVSNGRDLQPGSILKG